MKKLIIICALLTSVSFVSSAQTTEVKMQPAATINQANTGADPTPHKLTATELYATAKTAEKKTKALQGKLGLTKEQYDAVYKSELRYQTQYDVYPANGIAVPKGALSNMISGRKKRMQAILTPQQFEKYQAISHVASNK